MSTDDLRGTPGQRERYARHADLLRRLAAAKTMHDESHAGHPCSLGPFCIGRRGVDLLAAEGMDQPESTVELLLVAIAEYERARNAAAWHRARHEDAAARAMRLDADLLDAHGALATIEERMTALLAEAREWEAAADVIGPVGRVVEP